MTSLWLLSIPFLGAAALGGVVGYLLGRYDQRQSDQAVWAPPDHTRPDRVIAFPPQFPLRPSAPRPYLRVIDGRDPDGEGAA